ncbi:Type I restriction-modification system methyltransferase subunit [Serratia proteamaculans]|uniref:Eco57I restriction-modification methylase domain-containing protein n=1 Tax=Serratia proteamaculans TaxID=28151 RepID=UPI0021770F21|nr:Eco57I restriction-modification methylase domain-containing protein [Serratia proteamaculans]CAI1694627.1 Type I restriction-modification system methyltransferase subunit [Serratia proteamaculans]
MGSTTIKVFPESKVEGLLEIIDKVRLEYNKKLDESTRGQKGQFMTPASIAKIMANLFDSLDDNINIIDAGAGVGSLTAAVIERALRDFSPSSITATVWENEEILTKALDETFQQCNLMSSSYNTPFFGEIKREDFISSAVSIIESYRRGNATLRFNKAILNPPYLKIGSTSSERKLLKKVGVETGNLYSCFVSLALMILEDGGELVAITPRSFCNGPYFSDFRRILLDGNNLKKIKVFESRTKAFKEDRVLQENVIFHIIKGQEQGNVEISSLTCADDPNPIVRNSLFKDVVIPTNPDRFIHIVSNDEQALIARKIGGMPCCLADLGIEVSTGRVVDFRTKGNLRAYIDDNSIPLIYPMHFDKGVIKWPIDNSKKMNALAYNGETKSQTVPNGFYVLTKRLTSKEERRRVVAAVYSPEIADVDFVGFENKTNYFHAYGLPLDRDLARGLCIYLNSSMVDSYFRQFNGHTQVNASDLRNLRYPSKEVLIKLGSDAICFESHVIDELVEALYK